MSGMLKSEIASAIYLIFVLVALSSPFVVLFSNLIVRFKNNILRIIVKIVVASLIVASPFIDDYFWIKKLDGLCETEGNYHFYGTVEPTDGVFLDGGYVDWFLEAGAKYVDEKWGNQIRHHHYDANGKKVYEEITKSNARYYFSEKSDYLIDGVLTQWVTKLFDAQNSLVVATYRRYEYAQALPRWLGLNLAPSKACDFEEDYGRKIKELIKASFKTN